MKKTGALLLAFLLCLTFTACGAGEEASPKDKTQPTQSDNAPETEPQPHPSQGDTTSPVEPQPSQSDPAPAPDRHPLVGKWAYVDLILNADGTGSFGDAAHPFTWTEEGFVGTYMDGTPREENWTLTMENGVLSILWPGGAGDEEGYEIAYTRISGTPTDAASPMAGYWEREQLTYTYLADGTLECSAADETVSGTWSAEGDTLTMTAEIEGEITTDTCPYEIKGDQLICKWIEEEYTNHQIWVKQN